MTAGTRKKGFGIVGIIFLALGLFKMFTGDDWVVWIILGVLFGGLSGFSGKKEADGS